MLVELSIVPVALGPHMTEPVSMAIDLIAQSGLKYQVTAMGTLIEGDEESVWRLVRRCHETIRTKCGRIVTEVRIDDSGGNGPGISQSVRRIEERLAQPVSKVP